MKTELQPHKGTSETVIPVSTSRLSTCFNPTRVHLERWNETKPPEKATLLQPHKGASGTFRDLHIYNWSKTLQPHKGASGTVFHPIGVCGFLASTPQGCIWNPRALPGERLIYARFNPTRVHLERCSLTTR